MDKTSVSYKRLQAGDESLFAELVKLFNVEFEKPDLEYGIRDMYVQADVSDDHALAFYKNLGGEPADVVHFTFDISE